MSSCIKKNGHETQILFLVNHFSRPYSNEVLEEAVKASSGSDLIGISLMTNFFDNAVQITRKFKKDLNVPVIWGGVHPTLRPKECLDYADIVCIGEGETTIVEVLSAFEEKRPLRGIKGIWFKDNEDIIRNEMRPLINELDAIPFPDYDYEGHCILSDGHISPMNSKVLNKYTHGAYVTMSTRGCPFICTYCCNNFFHKLYQGEKIIRKRTIDNIIKELVTAKNMFPFITNMRFEDDCFFVYTDEEIEKFSHNYKKEVGLPLLIPGISPSTFSRNKLSMLADAGLRWIRMGIQTGSERTKQMYKRVYSNEKVADVIKTINEFKDRIMLPSYDVILDNPWETDEDLTDTLLFLSALPVPYKLNLFSLVFYPETELYEKAKRDGIIRDDLNDVYRKYVAGCKKTYVNNLFFLLNDYASVGKRLPPGAIKLLTDQKLRCLKLSWIIYVFFKIRILLSFRRLWRVSYYLSEAMKDMKKGEYARIKRFFGIVRLKKEGQ